MFKKKQIIAEPIIVPKSEKEIEEENLKVIEEFKKNPENREKALLLANQIKTEVFSHFFTEKQFLKKIKTTSQDFFIKINMLKLFGLVCERRIGENQEEVSYKIDIDKTNQIHFKEIEIKSHEYKLEILKKELLKLRGLVIV